MPRILPALAIPILLLGLTACATAPGGPSGQLSSYEGMTQGDGLRASVSERRIDASAGVIRTIAIEPPRLAPNAKTAWLSDESRTVLLREVEAQLCFELTERYELAGDPADADATVRTLVTRVKPTGGAGSAMSVADYRTRALTVVTAARFASPGLAG